MKSHQIIILLIGAFSSTILGMFFPEDIYGRAGVIIFFMEIGLFIVGLISFFLIRRLIENKSVQWLIVTVIAMSFSIVSLRNFPCESYCPSDFINQYSYVISNYDKLTLNDYKDSYRTPDVIINNVVLHKYGLSENLYTVQYLRISTGKHGMPEEIAEYPIWLSNKPPLYDRESLTYLLEEDHYNFNDSIGSERISFKVGLSGLNEVEDFYTGGGSSAVNGRIIRDSGVVDQGDIRVIVSMSNPEMHIDNSYGNLMRNILRIIK